MSSSRAVAPSRAPEIFAFFTDSERPRATVFLQRARPFRVARENRARGVRQNLRRDVRQNLRRDVRQNLRLERRHCVGQKNVSRVREPRFPSGPLIAFPRKDANLPSAFPVAGVGDDRPSNDRSSARLGAKPRSDDVGATFPNRKRPVSVEKPRKRLPREHCYERRRHARHRNAPRDGPRGHRRSRRPRGLPHQHRRRGLLLGTGTSRDAVGSRLTAGRPVPSRIARATPNALRRPRTAPIRRYARLVRTTRPIPSHDAA